MREYKFRVWDKENNCFFKPTYEAYKGRLEDLSIGLSGDLVMRTYDNPAIHESTFPNRFVIQQYTGLNDWEDKKIYEGDICAIWMGVKQDTPYVVEDLRELYLAMNNSDSYYRITRIAVIGNIYENRELLQ